MNASTAEQPPRRCRLVLVAPARPQSAQALAQALAGGDVASVIISRGELDETAYRAHCAAIVPVAQAANAAALVCDDTQAMGRSGADGVLLASATANLAETIARFSPHKIVGCGSARDRDRALELAAAGPDFLFFGRTDGDIRPEPHPKNLALARWWAEMIEMPCVVMGGSAVDSVVECAATGSDFVALGLAVFSHTDGPQEAVALANRLLDERAPPFAGD